MSVLDAIQSSTITPSKSLMIDKQVGSIEIGKKADILVWNIPDINHIPYSVTQPKIDLVLKNGKPVFTA